MFSIHGSVIRLQDACLTRFQQHQAPTPVPSPCDACIHQLPFHGFPYTLAATATATTATDTLLLAVQDAVDVDGGGMRHLWAVVGNATHIQLAALMPSCTSWITYEHIRVEQVQWAVIVDGPLLILGTATAWHLVGPRRGHWHHLQAIPNDSTRDHVQGVLGLRILAAHVETHDDHTTATLVAIDEGKPVALCFSMAYKSASARFAKIPWKHMGDHDLATLVHLPRTTAPATTVSVSSDMQSIWVCDAFTKRSFACPVHGVRRLVVLSLAPLELAVVCKDRVLIVQLEQSARVLHEMTAQDCVWTGECLVVARATGTLAWIPHATLVLPPTLVGKRMREVTPPRGGARSSAEEDPHGSRAVAMAAVTHRVVAEQERVQHQQVICRAKRELVQHGQDQLVASTRARGPMRRLQHPDGLLTVASARPLLLATRRQEWLGALAPSFVRSDPVAADGYDEALPAAPPAPPRVTVEVHPVRRHVWLVSVRVGAKALLAHCGYVPHASLHAALVVTPAQMDRGSRREGPRHASTHCTEVMWSPSMVEAMQNGTLRDVTLKTVLSWPLRRHANAVDVSVGAVWSAQDAEVGRATVSLGSFDMTHASSSRVLPVPLLFDAVVALVVPEGAPGRVRDEVEAYWDGVGQSMQDHACARCVARGGRRWRVIDAEGDAEVEWVRADGNVPGACGQCVLCDAMEAVTAKDAILGMVRLRVSSTQLLERLLVGLGDAVGEVQVMARRRIADKGRCMHALPIL